MSFFNFDSWKKKLAVQRSVSKFPKLGGGDDKSMSTAVK